MSENTFWLGCWTLVATAIVGITLGSLYYYHEQDLKLMRMVEQGANPIAARCALNAPISDGGYNAICMEALKK